MDTPEQPRFRQRVIAAVCCAFAIPAFAAILIAAICFAVVTWIQDEDQGDG